MKEIVLFEITDREAYYSWNSNCDALGRPDLRLDCGDYGFVKMSLADLFDKALTLTRLMTEAQRPMGAAENLLKTGGRVELRVHQVEFQGE